MGDTQNVSDTQKMQRAAGQSPAAEEILLFVYNALQAKGYDPTTQIVGYLISGDPTYITSYMSARSWICRLERDEILDELVRFYMNAHLAPNGR